MVHVIPIVMLRDATKILKKSALNRIDGLLLEVKIKIFFAC